MTRRSRAAFFFKIKAVLSVDVRPNRTAISVRLMQTSRPRFFLVPGSRKPLAASTSRGEEREQP